MPRSPPEMRTVRPFAAGAVLWGSAAGSGSRSGPDAGVFSGAALTGVSLVSCTGGAAAAASSGSGRVGLRCSVFGPASARSNVSSNSSLYKSQTLLSTIFGRSASRVKPLRREGNSFPHPAGAALCSLFRSRPALRRARRHLCGFDKFPLNNIAQSGEKIKWSPVIFFSRSSHFFHRFRGSRALPAGFAARLARSETKNSCKSCCAFIGPQSPFR